jgi:HupE / UreJ protein
VRNGRSAIWLAPWLALAAPAALAHEVPADVTVQLIVRPAGERVQVLVRAPLEAMRDVTFPTLGPGYLDLAGADSALHDAAELWLARNIELYENDRAVPLTIERVRASIPSDRSFATFAAALAHVRSPPLPVATQLVWQQALLDVELAAPIESATSRFALRPRLERLGLRVVNAVRFEAPNGVERVYQIEGETGLVPLDPRWQQSLARFLGQGFAHILGGIDHLLFLLCLVVPFRREMRTLVVIVTAFTAGHSVTLIAAAYGAAPTALWFPPLIETSIAASILYMAVENVIAPNRRTRWAIAFGFGLVHGFGFSFALTNTLQFAGDNVLTSLLAFNVGIELGQLLVLAALVLALNLVFRYVVAERVGTVLISIVVGHTAWHWLVERFAALRAFHVGLGEVLAELGASGLPWLAAALGAFWLAWLGWRRSGRRLAARRTGDAPDAP